MYVCNTTTFGVLYMFYRNEIKKVEKRKLVTKEYDFRVILHR